MLPKGNENIMENFTLFLHRKGLQEISIKRYKVVLRHFLRLNDVCLKNITQRHIDKFFFWLKNNPSLTNDTKDSYWIRFRIFLKWIKPRFDISQYNINVKRKKTPKEILTLDEVKSIILKTNNIRNATILSLLYDSGCRPHELLGLKPTDIEFDEDGMVISFDGKTGFRRIRIITTLNSDHLIKTYLNTIHRKKMKKYFI